MDGATARLSGIKLRPPFLTPDPIAPTLSPAPRRPLNNFPREIVSGQITVCVRTNPRRGVGVRQFLEAVD